MKEKRKGGRKEGWKEGRKEGREERKDYILNSNNKTADFSTKNDGNQNWKKVTANLEFDT